MLQRPSFKNQLACHMFLPQCVCYFVNTAFISSIKTMCIEIVFFMCVCFFFFVLSSSLFLWNTWQNIRLKSTAPICAIKVRHVGAEKQLRIW